MKRYVLIFIVLLQFVQLYSQDGYDITIRTKNFTRDTLIISYPYVKSVIVLDTLARNSEGYFKLKSDATLPGGLYYIGPKYNKKKFEIIISPEDNNFEVLIDFRNKPNLKFNNSKENSLWKRYKILAHKNNNLKKKYKKSKHLIKRDSVIVKLNELREKQIKKMPNSVAALLIKSDIEIVEPKYNGLTPEQKRNALVKYYIDNFLYKLDLSSKYTIRLPKTNSIIEKYIDQILNRDENAVIPKLDSMLNKMGVGSELYKYYLPAFRRRYSFPFQKWVDKVYIHIVNKYYNKEMSPWISQTEIDGVHIQAERKARTLIGKIFPDITLSTEKGKKVTISSIEAEHIVLIFWKPGCSHCKHAMPFIKKLQKKYSKKKLKIVSICTRKGDDSKRCWSSIKEEKIGKFHYNLADTKGNQNFLLKYNLVGVPSIYILDKNKKILDKKVRPEELNEVFRELVK